MALEGINRTAWGTRLLLTAVLASLVDSTGLCPILRAQHCCLSPNGCFNLPLASHPPPHPPPARPPPIDSIRDITGTEKNHHDSYITTLIIQDIWRDCIKPPEKHSAFNIEIRISRNTK